MLYAAYTETAMIMIIIQSLCEKIMPVLAICVQKWHHYDSKTVMQMAQEMAGME